MDLVLASTSRYRQSLLSRLGIPFTVADPKVDESPQQGEMPHETATRLARAKALAVAPRYPDALVIGCDQVATADGVVLGKPGSHAKAVAQLRMLSGRTATFLTALCVYNTRTGHSSVRTVPYEVTFRELDQPTIDSYLSKERPYDCTGSAKSEGLGIALIAKMHGEDPNALVGLPLIALVELLAENGLRVV